MKKIKMMGAAFAAILMMSPAAEAQNILGDLLGKVEQATGNVGSTIGNVVEGIFSTSNITVADIAGEYNADGPAVCFKSENFLKKAGGAAVAGTVETKLAPYYEKFGLNKLSLTINTDKTFTMNFGIMRLSGNISQNEDKTFEFNFTALGSLKLGSMTAYIQKSGSNVDLMFDATKLKNFISTISKYLNISSLNLIGEILDGYDGLCVGWKLKCVKSYATTSGSSTSALSTILGNTGKTTDTSTNTNTKTTTTTTTTKTTTNSSTKTTTTKGTEAVEKGVELLRGVLGGKK